MRTWRIAFAAGTAALALLLHAAPQAAALSFLHAAPRAGGLARILDDRGREVLLRGVNVNGLEDYYANASAPLQRSYPIDPARYRNGRCPQRNSAVESMAVCALDAPQLARLGYNSVRLAVSWSLLEPRPGKIDRTYVERVAQVVAWLRARGIWSIIDMHQDAWSKYVFTPAGQSCAPPARPVRGAHESDGAPRWASPILAPVCMTGARELDPAVIADFQRFYDDAPAPDGVGLQEHFAAVVAALAQRFRHERAVAGYDLFNEPNSGTRGPPAVDEQELFPFYAKVIHRMRAAVPGFRQLVFIEPDIVRDVTDRTGLTRPWSTWSSYRNVVYAPHVYTRVFTPKSFPLDGGYLSAVSDARALGVPLWVGEFGNGVADDGVLLRAHYDNQDALAIGSSLWVWKADQREAFSVLHGPFGAGVPFASRIEFTARAYPMATVGRLQSLGFRPASGAWRLVALAPRGAALARAGPTEILLPAHSPTRIRTRNARVTVHAVPSGNRVAEVWPRGGRYAVAAGSFRLP
ncbi:MAG: hypothetical protein NVSMB51_21250 [Solirubrobacteraceae bacterium]